MNSFPKIGGCVILYHPPIETATNIFSYLDQVNELLLIDNSEEESTKLLDILMPNNKITYYTSRKNFGVGYALNYCAERFSNQGYDFLLTMDQDSKATPHLVESLLKVAEENDNVGIVSPFHANKYATHLKTSKKIENVKTVMTSGNLLSLAAYKAIGPFRDDFFIDYIDMEYGLRLNSHGFKVVQLNNAILEHNLGEIVKRKFLFRRVLTTNHNPLRLYYRTRNRFYVIKKYKFKYPIYCLLDVYNFLKEIAKIVLYESECSEKLRMITKGFLDYRRKIFGKYCSDPKQG